MGWTELGQYSKVVKSPLENQYFASYSKERMKVIRSHIMKQNADLQEGISQA